MTTNESTTACIRAAHGGDREAIAGMIERFTPWLLTQARLRLRGRLSPLASPEDLVQDTWLIVLRRLGDLRARDDRMTPVLVRFLATTLRRRLCELLERELTGQGRRVADAASELSASVSEGCNQAAVRERAELLWQAVGAMLPRDQALVVLRGLEALPFAEIGALLAIEPNAAMSAWSRTRQRLRDLLGPLLSDDLEE